MLDSFAEILTRNPLISIIFISAVLSLAVTLIYKYLTNQALMKELKDEIKKMQQKMKAHPEKAMELQKQSMSMNMKLMKESFKPMLITIIPFFAIFWWLRTVFEGMVIIPLSFHIPLSAVETGVGWIGVYILSSLIFSTIFRKFLKVN